MTFTSFTTHGDIRMNNLLSNIAKKASVLALALCSTAIAFLPSTASAEERFVLVSHAPDADSWWNTIKTAIKEAGQNMDVSVEYRNPPTGDLADMARIIEQAVASNPQGIITTLADYDVLKGRLKKRRKKASQLSPSTLVLKSRAKRSGHCCTLVSQNTMQVLERVNAPRQMASKTSFV